MFLLVVEFLKCMLDKVVDSNLISGIDIDGLYKGISLLQFFANKLIFLPADIGMFKTLKRIFRCSARVSSLHINFHKISFIRIGVDKEYLSIVGNIVGCRMEQLFIKYLAPPLS